MNEAIAFKRSRIADRLHHPSGRKRDRNLRCPHHRDRHCLVHLSASRRPNAWGEYRGLKIRLLGLEVLVAADIVKTIAHELSFISLGLLAGLVLVRTFLSWTLVLEIDGRWPWQREPSPMSSRFGLKELSMH